MIVLIRCNDINSDSRAKKYIEYYDRKGIDYKIIAWDRIGTGDRLPKAIYCPAKSKYNQGGFAAIVDRIKWMSFILKTLFSFGEPLNIHACDLDAAFPAVVYKMFSRKRNFVLFDIFDWISDTLYNQGKIVSCAFRFMEWVSVKHADHIVICEKERVRQIPYNIEGRYSVLQNIPSFADSSFLVKSDKYAFGNGKRTLAYVGGFTLDRCLDILIDGARRGCYNLLIAGYGNGQILQMLKDAAESPYIKYFGKVAYKDGLNIMYNADVIYAMYSVVNPNHLYAAPNKYYEAMFVGKPLMTTNGIIVADKVKANGIGYAVDENLESLVKTVEGMSDDDIKVKSKKSASMWKTYRHATEDYLETTYSENFLNKC